MIRAFRRHRQYAHRLKQLRRLIEEAPTASVRWDLVTIAARILDPSAGARNPLGQSLSLSTHPQCGPMEPTLPPADGQPRQVSGESLAGGDRGTRHPDIV